MDRLEMIGGSRRGGIARRWLAVLGATAGAAAGCHRQPAAAHPVDLPVIMVSGCGVVLTGPACELPADRVLRVWTSRPLTHDQPLRADGRPLDAHPVVQAGAGWLQTFEIPAGARSLSVEGPTATTGWSMGVRAWEEPPAVLREARGLRRAGKGAAADALLARAIPTLAEPWKNRANALRARLAIDRVDMDTATRGLRQTAYAATAAGRLSDAADDLSALAHLLIVNQQRFAHARSVLDELAALTGNYPEGTSDRLYYEGVLAVRTGDWSLGLRSFRDAAAVAVRIGLTEGERNAREEEAILLAMLGRGSEALAIERAVMDGRPASRRCTEARGLVNLGWIRFLSAAAQGAGAPGSAELDSTLKGADAALAACGDDDTRRYNARLNLVLGALARGDTAEARVMLAGLDALAGGRTATGAMWELQARAELELAAGHARQALAWFDRARDLGRAVGAPETVWRAEAGRGQAFLRLGQRGPAIAALRAAEARLEETLVVLPAGEGRDQYVASHESATRKLVEALVATGRVGDALATARRARSRVLRLAVQAGRISALGPAERARWYGALSAYRAERTRLEADAASAWTHATSEIGSWNAIQRVREEGARRSLEDAYRVLNAASAARPLQPSLVQPGEQEVFLAYFPSGDGWLAFAAERGRAPRSVAIRGALAAEAGASALERFLQPFAEELRRCPHVRLFLTGELEAVDFEAAPWDGEPLGATHDVARSLDLAAASPIDEQPPPPGVLMVADPQSDLPSAADEAADVRSAFAQRPVTTLMHAEATRERVLAALPDVGILHFAGHSAFSGVDGIESGLRLAGDTRLTLPDLLALPRAPALVVLSACEAGREAATRVSLGLGLAQAFVASGAQAVFAPVRPIDDRVARQIVVAFYREASAPPTFDYRRAVRMARSALARQQVQDWSNFRLFLR